MRTYVVLVYVLIGVNLGESARILGVYPFPAHSHYQLGDAIFKELAKRGHEITVISPFKEKEPVPNFKQILVDDIFEKAKKMQDNLWLLSDYNIFQKIKFLDDLGIEFTELALNHTNVRRFLREKHSFDLVIVEHFLNDAYIGFCHHFNAPCVGVSSTVSPNWFNNKVGSPAPPSYVPQIFLGYTSKMNFWQRFHNAIVYVMIETSKYFHGYPAQNRLLQKYFPNAPHLDELYYNVSLIIYNGHISVSEVVPNLPNTIDIAGYHVRPPKALPQDLQEYMDNATHGVIYFSMGSNLKTTQFPEHVTKALLSVFSKLKQKVIWKYDGEELPNRPNNVLIRPWLPQNDILAHSNLVLFMTHGGLLSCIEAVYHGKPIFGLPVYSDQGMNLARAKEFGYGRYVWFAQVNENNLHEELREMLDNPKYSVDVKKRSEIMHDQPLRPLDRGIFWIEYVLRHNGAPHLRSEALNLTWYQYFLLDVIATCAAFLAVIFYTIKLIIRRVGSKCKPKKTKKAKKQ